MASGGAPSAAALRAAAILRAVFAAVPDGASALRVMQLDDLRALVEGGRLLRKTHHQHRTDGEVGGDQDVDAVMIGKGGAYDPTARP